MSNEYCEDSDIDDLFGTVNVTKWSDIDNDGNAVTIAARKARAIDVASNDIDDQLRQSPYLIPIVQPDGTTPTAIVDIAAKLAGSWLYSGRGTEDAQGNNRLTSVTGEAHLALANIRTGKTRIDAL